MSDDAQTAPAAGEADHNGKREVFFGIALVMSMLGLMGAGVLSWWMYPQDVSSFMLVVYTLSNVVSFVLGSKSGLASPPAGMALPVSSKPAA